MNILIAEDDRLVRHLLAGTLTKLGHQVLAAHDGTEALRLLEQTGATLVISDLRMPRMDGLELCRRIRKELQRYIYFILLTAVEGKSAYLEGMAAGADDFINKPFDREILTARLGVAERILSLQSQVRQLARLLPICAVCKKVRDDRNYWHQVDTYISKNTDTRFTHSYCPECFNRLLGESDVAKTATPNPEVA